MSSREAIDSGPDTWGRRWRRAFVPVRQPGDGVERLEVEPGRIRARVRDRSGQRMSVEVTTSAFSDEQWQRLVGRLSGRLRYASELIAGRVPATIEDAVHEVGLELFPEEVATSCDCGDAPECAHAAAVHRAMGDALEGDPSLLLALRGRDRSDLLLALRARRAGTEPEAVARRTERSSVPLDEVERDEVFRARGDLSSVRLHPSDPRDPAALLRRLGEPPLVDDIEPLEQLVGAAAQTAWKLAAGEGTEVADQELLLAELRARGMATAGEVAGALGWPPDRTQTVLDRLYEEGNLLRMGSGEGARYRA